MGKISLADYKNSYIETVRESIDDLRKQCGKLIDNVFDEEIINNIHIASHSLKGRSQVMGYPNIAGLSENIEKASNDILNEINKVDDKFIVSLKDSIDKLSLELAQIEKKR